MLHWRDINLHPDFSEGATAKERASEVGVIPEECLTLREGSEGYWRSGVGV